MENTFKIFNEKFFAGKKQIKWLDKDGFIEAEHPVRITVDDRGIKDHFNCYLVRVYNKERGVIAEKTFYFKDYMDFSQRDQGSQHRHAWYNRGELGWYIDRPLTTAPLVKAVFGFIDLYK